MQFACASCATRYSIADDKVVGEAISVRCRTCGQVITVGKDGLVRETGSAAPPSGAVWFVVIDGQQVGPCTEAELRQKAERGIIDGDTYGWREGLDTWYRLSQLSELRELTEVFRPVDMGAVSGRPRIAGPASSQPVDPTSPLAYPGELDDEPLGRPIFVAGVAAAPAVSSPLGGRPSRWEVQLALPRIFTAEPAPPTTDPLEEAFSTLERGWFSVDAPSAMWVGVATKISAGAIRKELHRQRLAATLEHDQAQLVLAQLGKLVRVELLPDSDEEFQVRALSVAEQPVLQSEVTRWEWLVTPRQPGEGKLLRIVATNLVDVDGQRLSKSHPVKTLTVRVLVRASAGAGGVTSAAALRRLMEQVLRVDADLEAFCLDYFPAVFVRFGRGMDRLEKTNLLLSLVDGAAILDGLCLHSPEAQRIWQAEAALAPSPAVAAAVPPASAAASQGPSVLPGALPPPPELAPPSTAPPELEPPSTAPPLAEPRASLAPAPVVIRIPVWWVVSSLSLAVLLLVIIWQFLSLRGSR